MSIHTELLKKIEDRTAQIGIIGLGYVGLPLAVAFAEAGTWEPLDQLTRFVYSDPKEGRSS